MYPLTGRKTNQQGRNLRHVTYDCSSARRIEMAMNEFSERIAVNSKTLTFAQGFALLNWRGAKAGEGGNEAISPTNLTAPPLLLFYVYAPPHVYSFVSYIFVHITDQ